MRKTTYKHGKVTEKWVSEDELLFNNINLSRASLLLSGMVGGFEHSLVFLNIEEGDRLKVMQKIRELESEVQGLIKDGSYESD